MDVLNTVLPILFVALIGYGAARLGALKHDEVKVISKLAFNIILPVLLFISTAKADLPSHLPWRLLASYFIPVLLVFAVAWLLAKFVFGYQPQQQSVFAMGASYSNVTIVGIPLSVFALGEAALFPLLIIISVHNLVLYSLGFVLAERQRLSWNKLLSSLGQILLKLVKTPITASLLLGLIVNVTAMPWYPPVLASVELLAKAGVPLALFALGAALQQYQLRGQVPAAILLMLLNMVLLPGLVGVFAFYIFELPDIWAKAILLIAAMPVGLSAYVFAQQYQQVAATIASSILLSSVVSIFSLSLVLYLL